MYIYAEYLLIENIVINYIILYVTKRFTRTDTSRLRLILAATLGALYAFVVFFPSLRFLAKFIVKVAVSILIIIVAFSPSKLYKFIKLFATFYIVTFVFGGAVFAFFYFFNVDAFMGGGIFYIRDLPTLVKLLIIGIFASSILLKFTWGYIQNIISKERVFIPITINLNNKKAKIMALMDTGNSLKDPISDIPVIVVEFCAIKDLLPDNVQRIFDQYKENNLEIISNVMSKSTEEVKFRLIPFKSLGLENGMLLGFKPDTVVLNEEDERVLSNIVVGIYNNTLSPDNKYMALLHPEILK
ncbi:sigma-E processing peptidase SpoIIGA [Sporosalibacterium faouarense]|uniref:sigma-E processing peptidase SpoIIGA n=1 Tax=Sporosalibacterium faouarense TaxID=516123 RepID=UPI001FAE90EC|nr:sigma-E processing peptidase SpoIIGA [Sporosalibacterium faouarense]